ncbi:MAG: hypothetical protein K1X74_06545 [Pirellulales bacterium]|nr:hypothetical protein [Pirellulales bacterium]
MRQLTFHLTTFIGATLFFCLALAGIYGYLRQGIALDAVATLLYLACGMTLMYYSLQMGSANRRRKEQAAGAFQRRAESTPGRADRHC